MVSWFQINLLKLVLEHAGCFRVGKLDDREPIFRVKLGKMGCFELGLPHYIRYLVTGDITRNHGGTTSEICVG